MNAISRKAKEIKMLNAIEVGSGEIVKVTRDGDSSGILFKLADEKSHLWVRRQIDGMCVANIKADTHNLELDTIYRYGIQGGSMIEVMAGGSSFFGDYGISKA